MRSRIHTRSAKATGFTLVELLLSLTIIGLIAVALGGLVQAGLRVQAHNDAGEDLFQEGFVAMERMTAGVKKCTFLLVPNNQTPARNLLAFSGVVNDDDDYYFDDPLFPRLDEDFSSDMDEDGLNGIGWFDDDGDGAIDEYSVEFSGMDDDEGGHDVDEDPIDGLDNDGDGNIDEDCGYDSNDDGAAGIRGIDDDGDGRIDEGEEWDDDEDGSYGEAGLIPLVYTTIDKSDILAEIFPYDGTADTLCTHVSEFEVTYVPPTKFGTDPLVLITLTLTGDDGESITFSEYVCPENTRQRTGKRVR